MQPIVRRCALLLHEGITIHATSSVLVKMVEVSEEERGSAGESY
jgi:hypothetical protein